MPKNNTDSLVLSGGPPFYLPGVFIECRETSATMVRRGEDGDDNGQRFLPMFFLCVVNGDHGCTGKEKSWPTFLPVGNLDVVPFHSTTSGI